MKVALVAEWMDAWRGGAETSTLQFMHELMGRGVELHVFTRSRPSPTPGMEVHTLNGAAMTRTRRTVTFTHRVERQLKGNGFDVVHAISPCRLANVYQPRGGTVAETIERNVALRPSAVARQSKRLTSRLNLRQRYMLKLERDLLRRPDGPIVVAISDYVVDQLKRHYGLPDHRIRKIYNAIQFEQAPENVRREHRARVRKEFGLRDDQIVALSIAHNFRLKGVRCWMQAMSALRQEMRQLRSLVIGRGDSPAWHQYARRLGISDSITFVGGTDRIGEFYHAADLLVHPTYYDPCSRVVLEGMAAGLPCITTKWDGAGEFLNEHGCGVVLSDPGDIRALAEAAQSLMTDDSRDMASLASDRLAEEVSMSRHVTEMMALYQDLAGCRI